MTEGMQRVSMKPSAPSAKSRLKDAYEDTTLFCGCTDLLTGLLILSAIGAVLTALSMAWSSQYSGWLKGFYMPWKTSYTVHITYGWKGTCATGAGVDFSSCQPYGNLPREADLAALGKSAAAKDWGHALYITMILTLVYQLASVVLCSAVLLCPGRALSWLCIRVLRGKGVRLYTGVTFIVATALFVTVAGFIVSANEDMINAIYTRGDGGTFLVPLWCTGQ
jgi:hypothetical protein